MKLVEKLSQNRRDFQGKYECQGCGFCKTDKGKYSYDDDNFHENVIPKMKCPNCGQSTTTLGLQNAPIATKYPPHQII